MTQFFADFQLWQKNYEQEIRRMKITGLSNQICAEFQRRLFKLDRNSKESLAFLFLRLTEIQKTLLLFFSID